MAEDAIFAYLDGIPTKGCWVELDEDTTWDDVNDALEAAGYRRSDEILVAVADGLAAKFLSEFDSFDLAGYRSCAAAEGESRAKLAFIDHFGEWDPDAFDDAYAGEADSSVDWAMHWFHDAHGESIRQAEEAGLQIDWESTAFALFVNDFYFDDGYVFRRL